METAKKSIYVLEDNDDIRELIGYLLTIENYEVQGYPTVKSFQANIKNGRPDLIILDVMLTDGNGIAVRDELKRNRETQDIPVLMMSAHAKLIDVTRTCEAADFIAKPFDIDELVNKVGHYLH